MDFKDIAASIHTLGCKVNIYESEVMEGLLLEAGFRMVPFTEKADVYIINTYSVTNIADRKSRQMLHRARALNPDAVVVACGCYAEAEEEERLLSDGVDLVIGNEEKGRIVRILEDYLKNGARPAKSPVSKAEAFRPLRLGALHGHTRADVKVQDGCSQFCTYCIIPYVRGRIRSRDAEDTVREVEGLVRGGTREIVLTGIHLSSYGKDLGPGEDLLSLIRAVHEVPGLSRIRLGSLEPRLVTRDFAEALAALPKVCPHFHLSLQSGSAKTLKRMNRRYTPEEYAESIRGLRAVYGAPGLTTDVIVGFPGETEADFEESMAFVREMAFSDLHVFRYSRRKGTAADRMPDQLTEAVKAERSRKLIALGEEMSEAFIASLDGKPAEALTEEPAVRDGAEGYTGYTREYVRVFLPGAAGPNRIVSGILRKGGGTAAEIPVFTENT
ncbi:MAG: tRNA (N(6)-L-threonylcarbamoyladenosine(37)-C(2))-methylthiotransferase MtaB [Lachnospiraceae bacterium]|nr:tRNA (N(6)-L-threonylcarbamoyladenosine(37)-C(2))-methylthiotransferase MtaB [Lachnospiraceae bacterium]